MEDQLIIELFWRRSENALSEIKGKYGAYLFTIAMNILRNHEDCEECLDDTYLAVWNSIPPDRPRSLPAYLGKIVRNISIDVYRKNRAKKRYKGFTVLLSELEECIPGILDASAPSSDDEIHEEISNWLRSLDADKRALFVRRYWRGEPLRLLSQEFNMSQSKLASLMFRLRNDLRNHLEGGGISI